MSGLPKAQEAAVATGGGGGVAEGWRVEGLSLEGAAQLLGRLAC